MKRAGLLLAMLSLISLINVSGQVSVTGTATTEIVPLATIKEEVQMNLGTFSTVDEGGSVTIVPDGTRLANGSVILQSGLASPGVFILSGSGSPTLNVLLPIEPVPLYHHSTANKIYLENWTKSISQKEFGSTRINIGATLRLKSVEANPPGIYSGKYQINILFD